MLVYKKGNIFNEDVDAIVNPVNCIGVMGKGLALQFKNRFPDNYIAYKTACKEHRIDIGKLFVFKSNPFYIINFPTKTNWRLPSKIEYIDRGLYDLCNVIDQFNITSIAIPPLGCGLGGLHWPDVKKLLDNRLKDVECDIRIMEN